MSMSTMAALTVADCVADSSCPMDGGFVSAPPHLAGNAFLLSAFTALIPINVFFGARYRMPLFATFFSLGLLLEVMGHIGRIMLRDNLASRAFYVMVMLGTAAGPTFIAAAIYVVLPHIMALYGEQFCVTPSPLWVGLFFFGFDVFTLTFQIVGCVFFVNGVTKPEMAQGINILLAGMGIQAASIVLYFVAYYFFLWKLTNNRDHIDRRHETVYMASRFKIFLLCLQFAAALILARTVARIVQLCAGPSSVEFQSQTLNMVLDSAVVLIACIVLTLAPPGVAFGREAWRHTSPHLQGHRRRSGNYSYQSQRSPYFVPSTSRTHNTTTTTTTDDRSYPYRSYYQQRQQSEPKPFEHQTPAHWQFPNLHKSPPRPKPVIAPRFQDMPEGQEFHQQDPGSAGSRNSDQGGSHGKHRTRGGSERRGSKRISPGQRDLVDEEALW